MTTTHPLPGMEDVDAPPPAAGWDYARWRVRNRPARAAVVEALRRLAGEAREIYPCNETILRAVHRDRPMKPRALELVLRKLETEDGLITRTPAPHAKSRRRIRFTFLGAPPPRRRESATLVTGAQPTCAQGRNLLAPKGATYLRPRAQPTCAHRSTEVVAHQAVPSVAPAPLNLIRNSEEERTLTLRAGEAESPETKAEDAVLAAEARLPGHRGVKARIALAVRRLAAAEAAALAAEPIQVGPPAPAPAPEPGGAGPELTPRLAAWPAPALAPAPPPPVETEALLRRLLSSPLGPAREAAIEAASARLADRIGDPHWTAYYRLRCREAAEGALPLKTLIGAWKASRSATATNPGAVFAAFLRDHGPPAAREKTGGWVASHHCPHPPAGKLFPRTPPL